MKSKAIQFGNIKLVMAIFVLLGYLIFPIEKTHGKEPADPFYTQQVYLSRIFAPQAWNTTTDAQEIVVAVIDAGVDINHEDLRENIWKNPGEIEGNGIDDDNNGFIDDVYGWDFISDAPDPRPKFEEDFSEFAMQHGTIVSGIIGARGGNGIGISGVAWKIKIMPLRALNAKGTGDIVAISRAINYARKNGADVINLSLVGKEASDMLEIELEQAYDENIVVVAASGNEGVNLNESPRYPVCSKGKKGEDLVLGVSAVDLIGRKPAFANYGDDCVDVSAPGVNIFSTQFTSTLESGYTQRYMGGWSGTSVAAPQVTAAVAIIKAQNPLITVSEIRDLFIENSDYIDDVNPSIPGMLGGGKINLERLVNAAQSPLERINKRTIVTGAGPGGGPHVRVYNSVGQIKQQFFAYDNSYKQGVYATMGDMTGNGVNEIITTPYAGAEPIVKIFDSSNNLIKEFLAYEKDMDAGLTASVYDIDSDGKLEIITAPLRGGSSLIRVFDANGLLKREFFAFNEALKSGVRISVADIDADGLGEIVTVPDAPLTPIVRVFTHYGFVENEFYPYDSGEIRALTISSGPNMIVVGNGNGNSPEIRTFDSRGVFVSSWYAYTPLFTGGVDSVVVDIDQDGKFEIITGPQKGGGPHLRIFDSSGKLITQWMAYNPGFRGGISVGATNFN